MQIENIFVQHFNIERERAAKLHSGGEMIHVEIIMRHNRFLIKIL